MTQKEKQLLLKDLCARLPYGVVLNVPTTDGSENKKLVSIVNEDDGVPCAAVYGTEEKKSDGSLISYAKTTYAICDVLPYLRPMSSMTDEEKEDYVSLSNHCISTSVGFAYLEAQVLVEWLNSCHFDFRNLIERGLALEAPEGMYN